MKLYYIRNTRTDQTFDTYENKFFSSNWQPEYAKEKSDLESLMKEDKEKFKDCIIEEEEAVKI